MKKLEEFLAQRGRKPASVEEQPALESPTIDVEGVVPQRGQMRQISAPVISKPEESSAIAVSESEKQLEDRLNNSHWSDAAIAAAIPAVVGALTGYGEEGLKYGADAGKNVMKDEKDLRTKLLELKAKRISKPAGSGKGTLQRYTVENPQTGEVEIRFFDTSSGATYGAGERAGFALQNLVNPETGMLEVASKSSPSARAYQPALQSDTGTDKYSIRNQGIVDKLQKEISKDPSYVKSKDQTNAANQLGVLIESGNKISPAAINSQLTILFEGSQRMSDADATRYGLPKDFAGKFNQQIELLASGQLDPKFRQELREMTNIIAQRAAAVGTSAIEKKAKLAEVNYGFDPRPRLKPLYESFGQKFSPSQELKQSEKNPAIDYPPVQTREYPPGSGQMRMFQKNSSGKWEIID